MVKQVAQTSNWILLSEQLVYTCLLICWDILWSSAEPETTWCFLPLLDSRPRPRQWLWFISHNKHQHSSMKRAHHWHFDRNSMFTFSSKGPLLFKIRKFWYIFIIWNLKWPAEMPDHRDSLALKVPDWTVKQSEFRDMPPQNINVFCLNIDLRLPNQERLHLLNLIYLFFSSSYIFKGIQKTSSGREEKITELYIAMPIPKT